MKTMQEPTSGKFITLEGIDGAGKSTHVNAIANWLRHRGHEVVVTREPGGTVLGEQMRSLVLGQPMDAITEALLMFAARREHLIQVIRPALLKGTWVLSDRFSDASHAYQGGGRGVAAFALQWLDDWTTEGLAPDLTFLFDVSPEVAQRRLSLNTPHPDRFEKEQAIFFERVRNAYLSRASMYPERFCILDAEASPDKVFSRMLDTLSVLA